MKFSKTFKNNIILMKNGKEKIINKKIKGLKIKIRGRNNTIKIEEPINFYNSNITIQGNNNNIFIQQSNNSIMNLAILLTCNVDNRNLLIKKDFSCVSANIVLADDNASLEIGEDCMFSAGIQIFCSDLHAIIDQNTGQVVNNISNVKIGNHCWLGLNAFLTKNVTISDNSIVGANSVVTKPFETSNVIIAGNPAKIIKKNISWDRENASLFNRKSQ